MKFLIIIFLFCITGCNVTQTSSTDLQNQISTKIFSDSVTELKINVFYEIGAEPYVGNLGLTTNSTWDIAESSYQALFQNHVARTVTVPKTLIQMTQIPDKAKTNWTSGELLPLAESLAPTLSNGTQRNVSLIFLNGLYQGNTGILGIQFAGSRFAFVFKDVVTGAGGTSVDQRYIEQATAVHELGHVVGLTNNGVPLQTNYEDAAHPKHSSNNSCVMYWAVESATSILTSLNHFIISNQLNLFATESLNDGRSYHP